MAIVFDRDHYQAVVEEGILQAKSWVWIATANIKDLHVVKGRGSVPLLHELARMAGEGIAIRILYAKDPSSRFKETFDCHDNLIEGAVEMQPCARMHAKIVVVDSEWAYWGSANLTGAGLGAKSVRNHNFEIGSVSRDPEEVRALMDYFDKIWMGAECGTCGRREECEDPIV